MFDLAVKYVGFLKHVPLLPHAFDSYLRLKMLIMHPGRLRLLDEIEREVCDWDSVQIKAHKFGGLEFTTGNEEIGHIHGNGLLDILFTTQIKQQLIAEGKAKEHHVFKKSGWISVMIADDKDKKIAIQLLRLSYERKLQKHSSN